MIVSVATTSPRDTEVADGAPQQAPPPPPVHLALLPPGAAVAVSRTLLWLRSEPAALAGLAISGLALEAAILIWWVGAFSLAGHPGFPAPGVDALVWTLGDGAQGIGRFTLLLIVAFLPTMPPSRPRPAATDAWRWPLQSPVR